MNIRSILLAATLLSGTYHTTRTMGLLTLASDASVVASIFSIAIQNASISDNWKIFKSIPLTQSRAIYSDASAIYPWIHLLLPIGGAVSVGTRFNGVIDSPIKGFFKGTLSLPLNLTIIVGAYALRLGLASENASKSWKLVDSFWKSVTNR